MKTYNTKHKKYIVENDVSTVSSMDAETLAKQIKAMENGSQAAKEAFVNDIKRKYNIKSPNSLNRFIKFMCQLKSGITYYAGYVSLFASPFAAAAGIIGSIRYADAGLAVIGVVGGIILALIGALCIKVWGKIFAAVNAAEVTESYNNIQYKNIKFQKMYLETKIMFDSVINITESRNFTESDANKTASNIILKSWNSCKDLFNKITSKTTNFMKKHPALSVGALVCIGLVVVYLMGGQSAAAAPSVNEKQARIDDSITKQSKTLNGRAPIDLLDPYERELVLQNLK